jgi:hypothetical protein
MAGQGLWMRPGCGSAGSWSWARSWARTAWPSALDLRRWQCGGLRSWAGARLVRSWLSPACTWSIVSAPGWPHRWQVSPSRCQTAVQRWAQSPGSRWARVLPRQLPMVGDAPYQCWVPAATGDQVVRRLSVWLPVQQPIRAAWRRDPAPPSRSTGLRDAAASTEKDFCGVAFRTKGVGLFGKRLKAPGDPV